MLRDSKGLTVSERAWRGEQQSLIIVS